MALSSYLLMRSGLRPLLIRPLLIRPLLIGTKLLNETHEVKFRWADLTKLLPKFRARQGLRNLDCAN